MKKLVKSIFSLIVIFTILFSFNNVFAIEHMVEKEEKDGITPFATTQYAYSIGTVFAVPKHNGDNFKTNAINAANKYAQISGVRSYYNTEPDYTYMRGNNPRGQRRIGSYIVFINGHANQETICAASSNTTANRTGIKAGYDGTTTDSDGYVYTMAGLQSTNMSGVGIISFIGCHTGAWPNAEFSTSLPLRAVERGANAALGFRNDISSRVNYGPEWLNAYNQALVNGYTIDGALTYACMQYPTSNMSSCVMAEGNVNSKINPILTRSLNDLEIDDYKHLQITNPNIYIIAEKYDEEKPLYECQDKYEEIIELIQSQDKSFNINEYKVTSNIVNEESGISHFYFTKYINDNIKTNKVYMITTKNNLVNNIIIAGVKEENINNENSLNKNMLNTEINQFAINKDIKVKEKLLSTNSNLQENKNISNVNALLSTDEAIEDIQEYYYYDYNNCELKYILEYTKNCELSTKEREGIEIVIN